MTHVAFISSYIAKKRVKTLTQRSEFIELAKEIRQANNVQSLQLVFSKLEKHIENYGEPTYLVRQYVFAKMRICNPNEYNSYVSKKMAGK